MNTLQSISALHLVFSPHWCEHYRYFINLRVCLGGVSIGNSDAIQQRWNSETNSNKTTISTPVSITIALRSLFHLSLFHQFLILTLYSPKTGSKQSLPLPCCSCKTFPKQYFTAVIECMCNGGYLVRISRPQSLVPQHIKMNETLQSLCRLLMLLGMMEKADKMLWVKIKKKQQLEVEWTGTVISQHHMWGWGWNQSTLFCFDSKTIIIGFVSCILWLLCYTSGKPH